MRALAWLVLIALCGLGLPLFLCLGVWVDVSFFDYCSRVVLDGGVLYRDVFYHGFPGMIWAQAGLRWLFGWRPETLRLADFLIVCGIVRLLAGQVEAGRHTAAARLWSAALLLGCYFATTEWCHCQPDTWMLLPALGALVLSQRQVQALRDPTTSRKKLLRGALAEGLCWAAAFVIKPFVALSALACWLVAWLELRRSRPGIGRLFALDLGAVTAAGVLLGALTVGWLVASGNGPYFPEAILGWNQEYWSTSESWTFRAGMALTWLVPWSLVHLAALPLALALVIRAALGRALPSDRAAARDRLALLAAFYLGWLFQANFIQKQFSYHLVPPLLLGVTLVLAAASEGLAHARAAVRPALATALGAGLFFFLGWAVREHPLARVDRCRLWSRCVKEGSTPELRNQLKLETQATEPNWVELEQVAHFLRRQGVADGELTCYGISSMHLYRDLQVRASSRYLLLWATLRFFPSHKPEIVRELFDSPQRFFVLDRKMLSWDLVPDTEPIQPNLHLLATFCSGPPVYRSGRYLVYRVTAGNRTEGAGQQLPAGTKKSSPDGG